MKIVEFYYNKLFLNKNLYFIMEFNKKHHLFVRNVRLKEEFDDFCKEFHWKKKGIIEQVIENILLLYNSGELDKTNRHFSITLTTSGFVSKS